MSLNLRFELRYLLGDTPWDSGITPPELIKFLSERPAGKALEFGCGTGTNAITLARQNWEVVALDSSWIAILKARRKAQRAGVDVKFLRADAAAAPMLKGVQPPYDLALDIGCFHALDEERRASYAQHLPRLVAPGGTYLLYSFLDEGQEMTRNWPAEADIISGIAPRFTAIDIEHGHFEQRPSAWFTFRREAA